VGPDGTVYLPTLRAWAAQVREDIASTPARRLLGGSGDRPTELLLSGLNFANGVAVHGSGEWLVVNELGSYRMVRCWLAGPRRGQS
jgi:sugar lactone lactonase YvrE